MKKRISILIISLLGIALLSAQDGRTIMERVSNQSSPSTTHALIKMILIDHRGQESERVVEQWSAEDNNGDTHSVMVFHSPASVENTRFLTKENQDRNDDQWIYLPNLNRVRRIAASESDSSFMGSEFTYHDMESRELENYDYRYLRDESLLGYDCHVVESIPREGTDSPYYKTISWVTVDQDINTVIRVEIYSSANEVLKIMEVEELTQIDGYWVPQVLTMTNQQNNRATTLQQMRLELDRPVNSQRFSQRFLETGRTGN